MGWRGGEGGGGGVACAYGWEGEGRGGVADEGGGRKFMGNTMVTEFKKKNRKKKRKSRRNKETKKELSSFSLSLFLRMLASPPVFCE